MSHFSLSLLSGLYAYIDPASGSIMLQVIIAGTVGAFGYFFGPIIRFVRKLRGKNAESSAEPPQNSDNAEKSGETR